MPPAPSLATIFQTQGDAVIGEKGGASTPDAPVPRVGYAPAGTHIHTARRKSIVHKYFITLMLGFSFLQRMYRAKFRGEYNVQIHENFSYQNTIRLEKVNKICLHSLQFEAIFPLKP